MPASLVRAFAFLVVLLLAPVALAQTAVPAGVTQGPSVEGVTEYRLGNGLRVLLMPDATKATTTVNVTYLVGSRHENYGETGMAHLLEHLVFKGTPTIPSVFAELGRRGMRFNGTTSFDRTNYFETFSADDENLDWALRMEAERMTQSTFSKADLDTEMTRRAQRVRDRRERSAARAVEAAAGARVRLAQLRQRRRSAHARTSRTSTSIACARSTARYYQPDNAVLIVAGQFEPAKTLALIVKYFGAIPKPTRTLPRLYTSEPVQDGERTVTRASRRLAEALGILFRTLPGAHPDCGRARGARRDHDDRAVGAHVPRARRDEEGERRRHAGRSR